MGEELFITSDGAEKLRQELVFLKETSRKEISERLRSAIQMGDLSENADYHKAKEDQAFLEGRILELEYILSNSTIVEKFDGNRELVDIGARVTILEDGEDPFTYLIVGVKEADPKNGKISNESPIGKALMGHRIGDVVNVETPSGSIKLRIVQIS
jgi:transcription elongation factor GreA